MTKVKFDTEACKGCLLCVEVCPKKIITVSEKINKKGYNYVHVLEQDKCISCASCAKMCPDCVITVER